MGALDVPLAAASAAPILAGIAAVGSFATSLIGIYVLARAQSYKQLLKDLSDVVQTALEEKLAAEQRGPAIARYVEDTMRRVIHDQGLADNTTGYKRRKWDNR